MIKEVEIPEGVKVSFSDCMLKASGPKGDLSRRISCQGIKITVEDKKIVFESETERRKMKSLAGTWASHARNLIDGVNHGYEARLKAVYSHFPMKLNMDGNKFILGNFLGGREDVSVTIKGNVTVKIEKEEVIVTGIDKEEVGQAASLIENLARVKRFDRRIFQDGIHLTKKAHPVGKG
jgi:large subunit ribosomal protein L6